MNNREINSDIMGKIYCTECGAELDESMHFCSKCGQSLDDSKNDYESEKKDISFIALLLMVDDGYGLGYRYSKSKIIGIIVFCLIFIFLYVIFLSKVGMKWIGSVLLICLIFYVICVGSGFIYRKFRETDWG